RQTSPGGLEVVKDEQDRHIPQIVGEDSLDDRRTFRRALREDVFQAPTAEPREEGGEVSEEHRPRRPILDFEPVDVRPRALPHEPVRHERALSDPREARYDEERRGRGAPGIEGAAFLRPAEDPTEAAYRVPPEDGCHGPGTDSLELREVQTPTAEEGDRGREVHVGREDLGDVR